MSNILSYTCDAHQTANVYMRVTACYLKWALVSFTISRIRYHQKKN